MQFDLFRRIIPAPVSSEQLSTKAERGVISDPRKMFKLIVAHLPEIAAGKECSWKPSVHLFQQSSQSTSSALPALVAAFDDSRTRSLHTPDLLPEQEQLLAKAQERAQVKVFQLLENLLAQDDSVRSVANELLDASRIRVDEKMFLGELISHINRSASEPCSSTGSERFRLILAPLFRYWTFSSITHQEATEFLEHHPARQLLHSSLDTLLSPSLSGSTRVRAHLLAFLLCGELVAEHVRVRDNRQLQRFGRLLSESTESHSEAVTSLNRVLRHLLDESHLTRALRATSRELFDGNRDTAVLFKGLSRVAIPARSHHTEQGTLLMEKLIEAGLHNDVNQIARLAIATFAGDSGERSPYLARKFPTLRLLARELSASAPLIRFTLGLKSREDLERSLEAWRCANEGTSLRHRLGKEVQAVVALVESHRDNLFAPIAAAAESTVTMPATILRDVLKESPSMSTVTHAPRTDQDVVLITGASQGIGRAIVDQLKDRDNCVIIATAREGSLHLLHNLRKNCDPSFIVRPLDVTKESDRQRLVKELSSRGLTVTTLINNAGVCGRGAFEHLGSAELIDQLNTNVLGGAELARLVLPGMKREGRGRIIAVSSLSGMMGVPTMGAYSATKFALEGLYESLYYEVKPLDIKVTLMQLGFIRSESFLNSRFAPATVASVAKGDAYGVMTTKMNEGITKGMRWAFTTPATVAKVTAKLLDSPNPPLRKVVGLDGHLFTLFRRVAPRALYHWAVYNSLYGKGTWEEAMRREREQDR